MLPAQAGMIRRASSSPRPCGRAPRASGDDPAYTYFVEGAVTGGPGAVAESAAKPELSGQFTPVTETLSKIASALGLDIRLVPRT